MSRDWLPRVQSGVEGAVSVTLMLWATRDALLFMERFALLLGVMLMAQGLISWERYLDMTAKKSPNSNER